MKKILSILIICLIFSSSQSFADDDTSFSWKLKNAPIKNEILLEEEVEKSEIIEDKAQTLFQNPEMGLKVKEDKAQLNEPLLADKLRINFETGIVKDLSFFGAYQGGFNINMQPDKTNTTYDLGFSDVGVVGRFRDEKTDFKIMFNAARQLPNLSFFQGMISDVYVATNVIPHHRLLVGNSRTPIGVEGGQSSYTLPFVARSQISRNYGGIRAVGVKLIGDYKYIEYNLGGYSSDRFFQEFFPGGEFTGWVTFKPFANLDEEKYGKLLFGGGLNTGNRNGSYTVGGAHISYNYKKLSTSFEYAIADGSNGVNYNPNKSDGFYATIGYKIHPKVQLLARYDQFNPNRANSNLRKEYSAGINYFIKGEALRLILNYVFCQNEFDQNSNRIMFATQILL